MGRVWKKVLGNCGESETGYVVEKGCGESVGVVRV